MSQTSDKKPYLSNKPLYDPDLDLPERLPGVLRAKIKGDSSDHTFQDEEFHLFKTIREIVWQGSVWSFCGLYCPALAFVYLAMWLAHWYVLSTLKDTKTNFYKNYNIMTFFWCSMFFLTLFMFLTRMTDLPNEFAIFLANLLDPWVKSTFAGK